MYINTQVINYTNKYQTGGQELILSHKPFDVYQHLSD